MHQKSPPVQQNWNQYDILIPTCMTTQSQRRLNDYSPHALKPLPFTRKELGWTPEDPHDSKHE